jgi:hypothetical protein
MRRVFALLFVMALHGPASAGVDDTYARASPSIWSSDFYVQRIGRNTFRKSVAVLIGVGAYDQFTRLSAPAADALRVRDFLRDEAGFDQIITLTDDKATYPRIAELMEKTIPDALGQNDRFLFYFSGHGVTRTLATTKRGYLVLKKSGYGEWQDMVDMERMKQWAENVAQARHSLFLIDACFSGLAAYEAKAGDVREKTIARLMQPGHYIVTAGTEGEETYIYKGESLFTQAFLSAARGDGLASSDGIISLSEMMTRINRTLDAKQAEIGDKIRMTPQKYYARLSNNAGEFFFLQGRPGISTVNTQIPASIEAKAGPDTPLLATPSVTAAPLQTGPRTAPSSFEIKKGVEATGSQSGATSYVRSIGECEQKCAASKECRVFTYEQSGRACFAYAQARLVANPAYDSGLRTDTSLQTGPGVTLPSFEIKRGVEATGSQSGATSYAGSIGECEQKCVASKECRVFTYEQSGRACFVYSQARLVANPAYDSGLRTAPSLQTGPRTPLPSGMILIEGVR